MRTTQLRAEGSATPERLATIAAYDARNHKIIEADANGNRTSDTDSRCSIDVSESCERTPLNRLP